MFLAGTPGDDDAGDVFQAGSFNGDLSSWNVVQVTTMQGMFAEASSFSGNLSSWNVGQDLSGGHDCHVNVFDCGQLQRRSMFLTNLERRPSEPSELYCLGDDKQHPWLEQAKARSGRRKRGFDQP